MEWGNAKKFVIILLVLLNVLLAGLNYKQRQETNMTAAQERAIFEVLSQNGITMYTDLLMDTKVMSRLSVEVPTYSKETLERIFFSGEKTTVTESGEEILYRGKDATLTIAGSHGLLQKERVKSGKEGLKKAEAQRIAEDFLDQTEHFFGAYDEPVVTEREDGFVVTFYGVYKQENVFSNSFSVLVTQGGIKEIAFEYCSVQGYSGEKRDLRYCDEALLSFMREWKKEEPTEEATIYRIELGYEKMEKGSSSDDGAIYLDPCYRIYLMDEEEPYLINAYTCQIVQKE